MNQTSPPRPLPRHAWRADAFTKVPINRTATVRTRTASSALADAIGEWLIDRELDDFEDAVPLLRRHAADAAFE